MARRSKIHRAKNPLQVVTGTRAVLYVAGGTRDRRTRAASLQKEAQARGYTVVASFTDAVEGDVPLSDRPGLTDALVALRTKNSDVLFAPDRDALGDAIDQVVLADLAQRSGAELIVADGSQPPDADPVELSIALRVSHLFTAVDRAHLRSLRDSGQQIERARRKNLFGRCPWGYRVASDGSLQPDEGEQRVTAVIRHMRMQGYKLREIVAALRERGVVGRNGNPIGMTRTFEILNQGRDSGAR